MITKLELGGITVDVVQKDIKNVHLSAYPPNGRVKISAPLRMNAATIPRLRYIQDRLDQAATGEAEGPEARVASRISRS